MTGDRVTVDGVGDVRPGREAITGADGRAGSNGAAGRRREQRMVPDVEPRSYYGLPVLNGPVWEARDIAGYLFLGGLAGGSSAIAAFADLTGQRRLARRSKLAGVAAIGLSTAALIHDLGRPERFYNMLRTFKPTSPMSVGSWLLAGFGPVAGVAAVSDLTGRLPRVGAAATGTAALLGSAVATYTAALVSDTAVPAWHDGFRQMPAVFASSALSSAAGFALAAAPSAEVEPVRRLAVAAAVVEEASLEWMSRSMDPAVVVPYHHGRAARLLKAARALTLAGASLAAVAKRRRSAATAAGACLLAGSALTRFGIFHAGAQSAEDPHATIEPQRARLGWGSAAGRRASA